MACPQMDGERNNFSVNGSPNIFLGMSREHDDYW